MRQFFFCGCVAVTLLAASLAGAAPPPAPVAAPSPSASSPATGTPEDARNHMLRGMAAIEMAKSPDDLGVAEDEFRMATEIAPQMAVAWFNLGKAQTQLGHYAAAIVSYRQYLALAPGAKDAQSVRDEIVKLEFRQELAAKVKAQVGSWVGRDGTPYNLTLDGNRLTLVTGQRRLPQDEVRSNYLGGGSTNPVHAEYQLLLHGNHLTGTWSRAAVSADKCMVPPDTSEATGDLDGKGGKMVLHYTRTVYEATTQMALLGDDSCVGVVAGERKSAEEVLYGPLGKGGLGVQLRGLYAWWDGGFSLVHFGWQGRLGVTNVKPGTPVFEAGLRDDDEILAIDGVAVKTLSAGEAVMRLHGDIGSSVTLEIVREDQKEPLSLTLRRVEVPVAVPQDVSTAWLN